MQGRLGTLLVAVALVVSVMPAPDAVAAPTWSVEPSANRAGVANILSDVSCPTPTKCVAVGAYRNFVLPGPATPAGSLIETYSSGKWTANASPGQGGVSRLLGVSCPTASRCYAIGQSHTSPGPLIATSSGGPWSQMASPAFADPTYFASISCGDETHCVAVGLFGSADLDPVILSLANGVWSIATLPDLGATQYDLRAVSCATATRCIAVGRRQGPTSGRTIALQLSGGVWTKMPTRNRTANSNWFTGISCTSTTRCTAIGAFTSTANKMRTLIESWNGTEWTLVASPNRGPGHQTLTDVSCTVASRCVAVGADSNGLPMILRLAGGVWAIEASPQHAFGYSLFAVDCITGGGCVAVGQSDSAASLVSRTLVIRRAVS